MSAVRRKMLTYFYPLGLLLILSSFKLNAQKPVFYWTFDGKDSLVDEVQRKKLDIVSYNTRITRIKGISGLAIKPDSKESLIVTNLLNPTPDFQDFTLEFAFRGTQFSYASFPSPDFRINFSSQGLNINYTVMRGNNIVNERWDLPLNGIGVASYNNLADGNWHHFIFVGTKSGKFEVWIDGRQDGLFVKNSLPFDGWVFTGRDAFKTNSALDELAFYSWALSPELIRQHAFELINGKSYSFQINKSITSTLDKLFKQELPKFDDKEFAPGYPQYNIQATEQLRSFPLPRYLSNHSMPRNFSWMDITYLHRELPQSGGRGFGKINPKKAVELTEELVRNWNYYIELVTIRSDSLTAKSKYTNPAEIYLSLINFANSNPQFPAATILVQMQNRPVDAGFSRSSPFVIAQDLQSRFYLCDNNGRPIIYNNKKWLNPFTSTELVQKDGLTSAFYLRQLTKQLNRKLDMINENGEWFGHKWPEKLLQQSSDVSAFMKRSGMDFNEMNGWMQFYFDSLYKATILKNVPLKDVKFTFYNVSATNSSYWPQYSQRIETNSFFNGTPISTPSFYPSRPDNWRLASGSLNGYGAIAEGRRIELGLGVKYCAPFVSAGWGLEESNIRPAQWLGLLKSMIMLGSKFFHVGYFNVTGQTGWPNGVGPNDPRGYIYQAAMPSYAQALASHVWDFIENGSLLEDPLAEESEIPFAFKSLAPNHLVMVRRLGRKYLIFGTVQPSSNFINNAAQEAATSIILEGKSLNFNIRRQGSMYILDVTDSLPVFYQLDGWHQYEHPSNWSKNFRIEAENFTRTDKKVNIITDATSFNYLKYITYTRLVSKDTIQYEVGGRGGKWSKIAIRCKRVKGSPVITFISGDFQKTVNILSNKWGDVYLSIGKQKSEGMAEWRVTVSGGEVDIDYLEWRIK